MWKTLRSPSVIIGIVVVLLIPFAFVFQNSPMPGMGGGAAGSLFGKPVPWSTFEEHLRWNLLWREASLPKNLPNEEVQHILKQDTWDRLMLLEEAKRQRVAISDEELAKFIRSMPLFVAEGQFFADRYHAIIARLGMTPQRFERQLRESLQLEKLVNTVRESVSVSDDQVRQAYREQHEQARIAYALVNTADYLESAAQGITDEQIRAYYDAHPEDFRTQEKLAFDYVGKTRDAILAAIGVTDQEIDDALAEQPSITDGSETEAPDRQKLRDALIEKKLGEQMTALEMDLQQSLDEKKSLDAIAQEHQLAKQSVGPLVIGQEWDQSLDPMLILNALGTKEGETSPVIRTQSGVYVLQLTKRELATVQPFEAVTDAAKAHLISRRAQEAAKQAAVKIHDEINAKLRSGASFIDAAKALGLLVVEIPPFKRSDPIEGFRDPRPIAAAAFAAAPETLAGPVDLPNSIALIYAKERIPADETAFDLEKEQLRELLLTQTRESHFSSWLMELRTRANLKSFMEEPASEQNAPSAKGDTSSEP